MSAPSLESLRDIHLPPPPFPAAVLADGGGWAAGVLVLAAAAWGLRRHLRRRPLRAALGELERLASAWRRDGDTTALAGGLSRLLRRYAQARYPGAGVAGLTGRDWLAFLDAHGGEGAFLDGPGAALAWRPYRDGGEVDEAALVALVRRWLEANRP